MADAIRVLSMDGVEKAKIEARKKGHLAYETAQEAGSIKVTVHVRGGNR